MQPARRVVVAVLLVVGTVVLASCDGSSPSEPGAGPAPWAGGWQGTTGQGRGLAFTAGGTAAEPLVTNIDLIVEMDELFQGTDGVTCLSKVVTVDAPVSEPIVGGSFDVIYQFSHPSSPLLGLVFRLQGSFESTTSAAGTLMAEVPAGESCGGRGETTWTARRL